jgi:hypothetical protein
MKPAGASELVGGQNAGRGIGFGRLVKTELPDVDATDWKRRRGCGRRPGAALAVSGAEVSETLYLYVFNL